MEIANYSKDLFKKVFRGFEYNCLEVRRGRDYREFKYFQEAVLYFTFNLCELNPTNRLGEISHKFLKLPFFEGPDQRRGIYKPIRYIILPVLWKDHKAVERKKQKKLSFLANELSNAGQHVQGYIVRTIVKPYIRDLNRKWSKMTALDKLKTVSPTSARKF